MPAPDQTEAAATGLAGVRERLIERLEERGTYRRWVLVTVLVGMFATTFPITILTVSLGAIAEDFEVSEALITWVIAAPMLASAVALPVLGKMGDLYGQRKVFLIGFALATVAAGLTALAWSALALIGLRTLTQVIGAATQPSSMALIMRIFPPKERVKALGWWSLVGAGSPAVGLAVGGPLVELVGWRVVFAVQAGLAVVPVAVAMLVLKEMGERKKARFDIPGAATLAVTGGGLMFALTQSAEWGWSHPAVVGALVVAPLAGLLFVRVEQRTEFPLIPLELLRRRNFVAPIISGFFGGAAYMGGFVLAPLLMRSVMGWSLSAIAFLMLLRPLTYSLSAPIGGQIGARIGERGGAVIGSCMLALSMMLFAFGAFVEGAVLIGAALVLQGVGNGVSRPSLTATIANAVDEDDLGMASASQRMLHQIGNAFGITVLTAVYAGVATPGAFSRAYVVAAVLGALAVGAAAMIRGDSRDVDDEGEHLSRDVERPGNEAGEIEPVAGGEGAAEEARRSG
jgi:MFS family permease